MRYQFVIETYETERIKVVSAGSKRGPSVHEHMAHQCVSEDIWFREMLGIDVGAPPIAETGSPDPNQRSGLA